MATSQNGWPASENKAQIAVETFRVGSVVFPGGVKAGSVAAVLGYVAGEFHHRVEPLVEGWCWGYNYRPVTGGGALSNHASGTAIDVNAPNHPYGAASRTFTAAQVKTIHKILQEVDQVVRWGGDYSGTRDEMHFEIDANLANVDRVAAILQNREDDTVSALDDTIRDIAYRVLDELQGNEKQTNGPSKGTPLPQVRDVNVMKWRLEAVMNARETVSDGPTKGEAVPLVQLLHKILAKLDEQ